MAAKYGHLINRWTVAAVAALAVMAALLAAALPVWAQEDTPPSLSNAEAVFDYGENGTGHIITYSARDPENKPVFWTLGGVDAADFTIDGGTLRFKSSPNYEVPTDRLDDANNNGSADTGEDPASNNVYKVTVRFSAGGEDGIPGDDDYDGDDLGEIELTVNVINVNEPGSVVISPMQPQVGTRLTAILTDEDNVAPTAGEWQWARSDSMAGTFTDIRDLSDQMTYRPTIDDLDMYLRVTVVYVDRAGANSKTVQEVSAYPVREDIVTSNQPPKYPDQSTLIGGDAIVRDDTDRFIPETAAAGTNVGAPVTAFDDATDIEVLTYSLRDAADADGKQNNSDADDDDMNPDTPSESDGHARTFNINEVTGQITVRAGAMLDADETDATNPYTVVVRAVDGDGHRGNTTVTIHVLPDGEPPRIDRIYVTGRVPTGHTVGDRVPTEMTHYESDRDNPTATVIDTNLDTDAATTVEPATYYATDPDDPTGAAIEWSLKGPDGGMFGIDPRMGPMATLSFGSGPDFENRADENEDNVYEVTIVATDGTGLTDKLDVTAKVINSTDDNEPGMVSFSNRQPEVATALTAMFEDDDKPIRELKWQWYRAATATTCDNRTPEDGPADAVDGVNQRRYFVENDTITEWVEILGATSASYTPEASDVDADTDVGKCLRATVTYRDDVDRTHSAGDVNTTDVDETLEGTWAATEQPVKAIDEENDSPVFTADGTIAGAPESVYRSEIAENSDASVISEALAAVDVHVWDHDNDATTPVVAREDDGADDLLTYTLSGRDEGFFTITGTIDNNSVVTTTLSAVADGQLTINGGADYESQREYRVRITATDPSGDSDFVDVIVDVTGVNEPPTWTSGDKREVYEENSTANVSTYQARDAEVPPAGITYSLVDTTTVDGTPIAAEDIADRDLFKIGSIGGHLEFKSSPNYEDPQDEDANNVYQVAVKAEVADDLNPRHAIYRKVTVIVTNVNEAPMFSETTDDPEISENPDDPEKEPPSAAKYLYLLNRGVGKPAANLPVAPNLDVGTPMVAVDDDNTFTATDYTGTGFSRTTRSIQLIDGLTYELSGAGAGPFHIVPSTGQILTMEKLDYEIKNEYDVTVKATDPWGLYGMIDLTIQVINVDEVPVPKILRISGDTSHTYEENGTGALGEYTVAAGGGVTAGSWSLEGPDAGNFRLEGTGMSRMLMFSNAPDYENPRGAAMSETNTNTYAVTLKVTDPSESDIYGTFGVTITVEDVDELGALSGSTTDVSVMEGATGALGTYTLTAIEDGPAVTWSLAGADMSHFRLDGTGMTRMLKFTRAPDFETPADADGDNEYMVTVMVKAGGEMEMVEVTVMVINVDELGTLSGSTSVSVNEGDTDLGTYTLTGTAADTADWSLAGADMSDFRLDGTGMTRMLKFARAPDFEAPADANTDNVYMVTVKATGGGETHTIDVTITVTNVNDAPAFPSTELGARDIAENTAAGINIGAPVMATDDDAADTLTYTLSGTDAASFDIGMSTGQLMTKAALDYETKMTYMVTVNANDGNGGTDSIDVTINVTDVDETTEPVDPVVARYDTNGTPGIQRDEVIAAINDYLFGTGDDAPSRAEVITLINLYLFG